MEEITSRGFDEHIRKSLFNSGHDFSTEKLDHARDAFNHALIETKHTTLKSGHFDEVLKHMEDHSGWKKLTHGQQEVFVSKMREHLGIKPAPEV